LAGPGLTASQEAGVELQSFARTGLGLGDDPTALLCPGGQSGEQDRLSHAAQPVDRDRLDGQAGLDSLKRDTPVGQFGVAARQRRW
jgi:hypothetical protein